MLNSVQTKFQLKKKEFQKEETRRRSNRTGKKKPRALRRDVKFLNKDIS